MNTTLHIGSTSWRYYTTKSAGYQQQMKENRLSGNVTGDETRRYARRVIPFAQFSACIF
jgi:hypothetical protein